MITTEHLIVIASAVVALVLQILVAPHIVIGYAYPNIVAAFCLVITLVRPDVFKYGLAFVMGLAYDFISGGPVGAMALTLTVGSVFVSWIFNRMNNDTLFMGIGTVAVGMLFVEVLYGLFLLLFGFSANLFEAFIYRTLPCFLYGTLFAAILYPIARRFLSGGTPMRSEITQLH